jgi:proteasome accessory factor C
MAENAALRALRLLDLVPYIVRNPGITVKELAERFEVSRDELIKDLNLLFMCGLPGYTPLELIDLSFEDGTVEVRDPQNLSLPRNFTESEALALRISLAALEEQTPKSHPSYPVIQSLRHKLANSFVSEIPEAAIDFVADREAIVIDAINKALDQEMDLQIEYLNSVRDSVTVREITPLSLSISKNQTLLLSYCHTAQGDRSFNARFIQSARVIARKSHISEMTNENSDKFPVILDISRMDSHFFENHKSVLQPQTGTTENRRYLLPVYQPDWIIRSAISEPSVIVIEPSGFRRAIVERCSTALEQYTVIG